LIGAVSATATNALALGSGHAAASSCVKDLDFAVKTEQLDNQAYALASSEVQTEEGLSPLIEDAYKAGQTDGSVQGIIAKEDAIASKIAADTKELTALSAKAKALDK
jgi:hypothetical protein